MPGRNQPRSSRGRSAIARKVINTNSTNGMMYQGSCFTLDGQLIKPCRDFGGNKKGGAAPSATGFMRSQPWKTSVPAKNMNYMFNMRYFRKNVTHYSELSELGDATHYSELSELGDVVCNPGVSSCTGPAGNGCTMTTATSDKLCCFTGGLDGKGCNDSSTLCGIDGDVSLCGRPVKDCSAIILGGWSTQTCNPTWETQWGCNTILVGPDCDRVESSSWEWADAPPYKNIIFRVVGCAGGRTWPKLNASMLDKARDWLTGTSNVGKINGISFDLEGLSITQVETWITQNMKEFEAAKEDWLEYVIAVPQPNNLDMPEYNNGKYFTHVAPMLYGVNTSYPNDNPWNKTSNAETLFKTLQDSTHNWPSDKIFFTYESFSAQDREHFPEADAANMFQHMVSACTTSTPPWPSSSPKITGPFAGILGWRASDTKRGCLPLTDLSNVKLIRDALMLNNDNLTTYDINHTGSLAYTPIKTYTTCNSGVSSCTGPAGNGCTMTTATSDKLCCFTGGLDGKGCNDSSTLCGITKKVELCDTSYNPCKNSPTDKRIVTYVVPDNWEPDNLPKFSDENITQLANNATHIIVAFAVNYEFNNPNATSCDQPTPPAFMTFDPPGGMQTHTDFIKQVKTANSSVKLLMSVGGSNMNPYWGACLTDTNIKGAAEMMIKRMKDPDAGEEEGMAYDGMDINIESSEEDNIIRAGLLIYELIEQRRIKGDDWLITIVPEVGLLGWPRWKVYLDNIILPNVDGINFMCVQNYNTWTEQIPGCASSYGGNIRDDFETLMRDTGLPADKIVPMVATEGGLGCSWGGNSNLIAEINTDQLACEYYRINSNFGGLGYWAFNYINKASCGGNVPDRTKCAMDLAGSLKSSLSSLSADCHGCDN